MEKQSIDASTMSIINLVKHYFNICNTAITQNEDSLLFSAALGVINQLKSGDEISIKVVDKQEEVTEYFTTRFVDGVFTPIVKGENKPDSQFTMTKDMLQDVLEHADEYIAHPEKLDWSWLTEK
jgi:translation elongation factor EF-Tu-like GTPase